VPDHFGERLAAVRQFLPRRERVFPGFLDNITLLRQTGIVDGISRWEVHERFTVGL
jgi:hypothetical protein